MNRLSVALIAHNEARNIGRALASVSWADEIVLVDCKSSDDTVKIAADLGVKIHSEPNRSNLNINKNIAIDHCREDWILIIDADETVSDALAGEIRREINSPRVEGYLIPRRNFVLGRWLRHGGQYPDYQLRLFRRGRGRFPAKHVHERLKIDGATGKLTKPMDHFPYMSLKEMMYKGMFYAEFEASHLNTRPGPISLAHLFRKGGIQPFLRFLRRYFLKGGYRDGPQGFAMAVFDLWNQSIRWLMLWELNREKQDTGVE